MLKREQVAPRVWAIFGDKPNDAAKAFIRFQEYYENPEMKGKKDISVSDIEKWWRRAREQGLSDVYYDAWSGFNIPGRVFLECLRSPEFRPNASLKDLFFPRWNVDEDELLSLIEDLPVDDIQNGYFIGLWKNSKDVLEHEVAHAFFSTNAAFKAEQMLNIGELPSDLYGHLVQRLKAMGYHSDVVHDEIQAYLSTYTDTLQEYFKTDQIKDYSHPFVDTFQRYRTLLKPS